MIETQKIQRVLVVKLRHHGDVLLTSPVFRVLKNKMPNVEIDALIYDETRAMLENHPDICNIFTISRSWKKNKISQIQNEWRLFSTLKNRNYDLIIHLTEHWRLAWTVRLLKPKYAIAPAVSGRNKFWRKSFTHLYFMHDHRRHTVEKNLDSLRRLGLRIDDSEKSLILEIPIDAENKIENILKDFQIQKKDYVHIHPASRWFFKCWNAQKWAAVIQKLKEKNQKIILSAAPDEKEKKYIDEILSFLENQNNVFVLNGVLNLKEMGALIKNSKLFLGVDSAPMHMAAALKCPQVALFGPSGDIEWAPWCAPNLKRVLTKTAEFPCRPCGADGCGGGKVSDCLEAISPDEVWRAIVDLKIF